MPPLPEGKINSLTLCTFNTSFSISNYEVLHARKKRIYALIMDILSSSNYSMVNGCPVSKNSPPKISSP
jgi:hypothetical protein